MDILVAGEEAADSIEDVSFAVTTQLLGEQETLFLPTGEEDSLEAVFDMQLDEGTITSKEELREVTETLTDDDLATMGTSAPVVLTENGEASAAAGGAPAPFRADEDPRLVMESFGPPFPDYEVDVGDTWPFESAEPTVGTFAGTATIVDEIEIGDDYAFVIEFSAGYTDLPATIPLEEMQTAFDASLLDVFTADPDVEIAVELLATTVEGTLTFIPSSGIPAELEVRTHDEVAVTATEAEGTATANLTVDSTSKYTHEQTDEAARFEISMILDQFEADPFVLADQALAPFGQYLWDDPDPEVLDSAFEVLGTTPEEVAPGFSLIRLSEDGTEWVDVVVLTNDGDYRGFPGLANELIYFWTERDGKSVTVNGTTAYRTTVDGREWLVWNNDTHTFIAIGPRSLAQDIMSLAIDAQYPYLWQQGDCLAFRDPDALPYSPFGELGLIHCGRSHEYEVLYSELLPEGPDDPYPDDIADRLRRGCGARFHDHVGAYPLESAFEVVTYLPDVDEWERGSRYTACVIYLEDADGKVPVFTRFDGAGSVNLLDIDVSTCLLTSFPVPCSDPHTFEVLSIETYDAPPDAEYPDIGLLYDEVAEVCDAELEAFGASEGEFDLVAFALTDMPLGWDSGVRDFLCAAYAIDEDDYPVDIVGELTGTWEAAPTQVDT